MVFFVRSQFCLFPKSDALLFDPLGPIDGFTDLCSKFYHKFRSSFLYQFNWSPWTNRRLTCFKIDVDDSCFKFDVENFFIFFKIKGFFKMLDLKFCLLMNQQKSLNDSNSLCLFELREDGKREKLFAFWSVNISHKIVNIDFKECAIHAA